MFRIIQQLIWEYLTVHRGILVGFGLYLAWGKRDAMKTVRECKFTHDLDMTTLVATRAETFR
jgi:hypothetical protein